ncbi:MAG: hypothetical protein U0324_16445 [Polyangiales bacterium]
MVVDVDDEHFEVPLPIATDDLLTDLTDLAARRRDLVRSLGAQGTPGEGRLLRCSSLTDGHHFARFAAPETGYFIDALDLPPWGLWVGGERRGDGVEVIAWIPSTLVGVVASVVGADQMAGLTWVE